MDEINEVDFLAGVEVGVGWRYLKGREWPLRFEGLTGRYRRASWQAGAVDSQTGRPVGILSADSWVRGLVEC